MQSQLAELGFSQTMMDGPVASLSGGWKMKLALGRAMLYKAQIMLLDEPTNHLDVKNVAWLEAYLKGLKDVTSVMVSHDSGFLDHVCQSIIHYEPNRKLRIYIVSGPLLSLLICCCSCVLRAEWEVLSGSAYCITNRCCHAGVLL